MIDAGAKSRGLFPFAAPVHQFRPKRKDSALGRLDGVNGTASGFEEGAARPGRHPQPQFAAGAVHVSPFKLLGLDAQKFGGAAEIVFGKIHKPGLLAASRATPPTLEAQTILHRRYSIRAAAPAVTLFAYAAPKGTGGKTAGATQGAGNPVGQTGQTIAFCRLSGGWPGEGVTDHRQRWSGPRSTCPSKAIFYRQEASICLTCREGSHSRETSSRI